ncbi:hypothetical protein [Isobaculum melis]|uniref:Uncharacterized protein n=1 Tax=Isobaculum melis TaxID=142588 RepID=A0A1H9RMC2_9LACT|nr:hypothetical protein [Isobaculum melis]SER73243.1 hypothetical protein SAMN04488559_104120 [Isobaculum melis]
MDGLLLDILLTGFITLGFITYLFLFFTTRFKKISYLSDSYSYGIDHLANGNNDISHYSWDSINVKCGNGNSSTTHETNHQPLFQLFYHQSLNSGSCFLFIE